MYYRRLNMSNIKYNYDLWNGVWRTKAKAKWKPKSPRSHRSRNITAMAMATATVHTVLAFMIGHQRTIGNNDNNVAAFHIEMIGIQQCRIAGGCWPMANGKDETRISCKRKTNGAHTNYGHQSKWIEGQNELKLCCQ